MLNCMYTVKGDKNICKYMYLQSPPVVCVVYRQYRQGRQSQLENTFRVLFKDVTIRRVRTTLHALYIIMCCKQRIYNK